MAKTMKFPYEVGKQLIIELKNGRIYEGTVSESTNNRVDLDDVVEYPYRKYYMMDLSFFIIELTSVVTLLDEIPPPKLITERIVPHPRARHDALLNMADKYIYMPVIDAKYFSAIEDLNNAETIGVVGVWHHEEQGPILTLLTLSTTTQVYIFDIKSYKRRSFPEELKTILESSHQEKVLHGATSLTDCLFYGHHVKLTNVYDTHIGDIQSLWHVKRERLQTFRNVSDCLTIYFNYPPMLNDILSTTEKEWKQRPLEEKQIFQLSRLIACVVLLKERQEWILKNDYSRHRKKKKSTNYYF